MISGALFRLRERDFTELHHHDGISPAWSISYRELEPYYGEHDEYFLMRKDSNRRQYRLFECMFPRARKLQRRHVALRVTREPALLRHLHSSRANTRDVMSRLVR